MKLFAIIVALLAEKYRPIELQRSETWLQRFANLAYTRLQNFGLSNGKISWLVIAVLPSIVLLIIQGFLPEFLNMLLGLLLLYFSFGLRSISNHFTNILESLSSEDIPSARSELKTWRGGSYDQLGSREIACLAIEDGVNAAFDHFFAVLFWFILLGPAGILLWRLTLSLRMEWNKLGSYPTTSACANETTDDASYAAASTHAYDILAWVPVRITGFIFALLGNFSDTTRVWQEQASSISTSTLAVLHCCIAGAVNVQLGLSYPQDGTVIERTIIGNGNPPNFEAMQRTAIILRNSLVAVLICLAAISITYAL